MTSYRLLAASLLCLCAGPARADTYTVAPGGSDGAAGTSDAPWETLQFAADQVAPGDTVVARPGSYQGFYLLTSGTSTLPIVFRGEPGALIDRDNPTTSDGINLEGADWIVIEGFEVSGTGRAGIRAVLCEHVTIRNNETHDNFRWGILTGFCDDLLIEGNSASGSEDEHGIYVSNSGDRPVIRGNRVFDNNANGIHMNGDVSMGGDGVISGALVENNIIWNNGLAGGSGINCDGVTDSVFRNNLIYETHASGISLYRIDGGAPSTGNLVAHNTVVVAADGRWAMNVQDTSTGNTLLNNIFLSEHDSRGSIDLCDTCTDGFASDYNVVLDRFSIDETFVDLSDWRAETGQDAHSIVAAPVEVFASFAANDFRLASDSPARDAGAATAGVTTDLLGVPRPVGEAVDIGAYEYCEGDQCAGGSGGGPDADTGAPDLGTSDAGAGDDGDAASDTPLTDSPSAGGGGRADDDEAGCGCRAVSRPDSVLWALLLVVFARRLRRRPGLSHSKQVPTGRVASPRHFR